MVSEARQAAVRTASWGSAPRRSALSAGSAVVALVALGGWVAVAGGLGVPRVTARQEWQRPPAAAGKLQPGCTAPRQACCTNASASPGGASGLPGGHTPGICSCCTLGLEGPGPSEKFLPNAAAVGAAAAVPQRVAAARARRAVIERIIVLSDEVFVFSNRSWFAECYVWWARFGVTEIVRRSSCSR